MKFLTPFVILALAASPAHAALSPFYDSGEQIETILMSTEVADVLGQAAVHALERTGTRADGAYEWTVRTLDCDLVVYLVPMPPKGVGMTTYTLDVSGSCD